MTDKKTPHERALEEIGMTVDEVQAGTAITFARDPADPRWMTITLRTPGTPRTAEEHLTGDAAQRRTMLYFLASAGGVCEHLAHVFSPDLLRESGVALAAQALQSTFATCKALFKLADERSAETPKMSKEEVRENRAQAKGLSEFLDALGVHANNPMRRVVERHLVSKLEANPSLTLSTGPLTFEPSGDVPTTGPVALKKALRAVDDPQTAHALHVVASVFKGARGALREPFHMRLFTALNMVASRYDTKGAEILDAIEPHDIDDHEAVGHLVWLIANSLHVFKGEELTHFMEAAAAGAPRLNTTLDVLVKKYHEQRADLVSRPPGDMSYLLTLAIALVTTESIEGNAEEGSPAQALAASEGESLLIAYDRACARLNVDPQFHMREVLLSPAFARPRAEADNNYLVNLAMLHRSAHVEEFIQIEAAHLTACERTGTDYRDALATSQRSQSLQEHAEELAKERAAARAAKAESKAVAITRTEQDALRRLCWVDLLAPDETKEEHLIKQALRAFSKRLHIDYTSMWAAVAKEEEALTKGHAKNDDERYLNACEELACEEDVFSAIERDLLSQLYFAACERADVSAVDHQSRRLAERSAQAPEGLRLLADAVRIAAHCNYDEHGKLQRAYLAACRWARVDALAIARAQRGLGGEQLPPAGEILTDRYLADLVFALDAVEPHSASRGEIVIAHIEACIRAGVDANTHILHMRKAA